MLLDWLLNRLSSFSAIFPQFICIMKTYSINFLKNICICTPILLNNLQVSSLNIAGHTSVLGKTRQLHAAARGVPATKDEIKV